MTMQEQFQIVFRKINEPDGVNFFYAEHSGNDNQYKFLAHLLGMLQVEDCEEVIQAIENAQNGLPFDADHGPDSISDDDQFDIVPPNVVYADGEWTIPMEDWKTLMQEWIDFKS